VSQAPLPFRPAVHPGQADTLVHFCGRGRPTVAEDVASLEPSERLDSILWEGRIRAFRPYGGTRPVVCFSESDRGGVEALLEVAGWQPWGLVVRRDWAWSLGGGPVWYVRDDLRSQAASSLGGELDSWLVRTDPSSSDWLHEREWRILRDAASSSAAVSLGIGDLVAIIVGDKSWEPSLVPTMDINPSTGTLGCVDQTPPLAVVPRWYWNGRRLEALDPVGVRYEPSPVQP
jgi:hypothetical protein